MSLLPVVSGKVALDSTATLVSDVFNGGIRFAQAGQAKCTTDVGTFFNQGIPMTADGAVSVVDATAGLPAGTTFSSGLPISGNRLCVSSNAVAITANGITFDAAGAVAATGFAPSIVSDPYFEYVSLLANTTSTNGAQNNTFLDGSTNAFSVTRNGNTTQGNFSPFSQTGWSNYFDGTGDYLTVPTNAALALATGDFTVECWVNVTGGAGTYRCAISFRNSGFNVLQPDLYIWNTGVVVWYVNGAAVITGTTNLTGAGWIHIAVVRNSGNTRLYVNGVQEGSTYVDSNNYPAPGTTLAVGSNPAVPQDFIGYISNLRIVKGTAVYTATFTPPTSPLTAITNTSLLTCQSNRFIDNSSNAFAITRNGDVSVQAFSPFNPTAAWSASTNGGSGYFDGTGDYLSVANSAAFQIGTGDFCMEGWFYTNSTSIQQLFGTKYVGGVNYILLQINRNSAGSNVVGFIQGGLDDTASGFISSSAAVFSTTSWNHAVLCRTGTTLSIFVNGLRAATVTSTVSSNSTQAFEIGDNTGFNRPFNGYIANVRLVKGSSPYDATLTTLTVPTAPLTAITNTSLLLNFTNAGIYDSASGNDLETVGNAQVSTVQAKWGTTSMAFDGTGDSLTAVDRPALRFGTAPFTIEGWVYVGNIPFDYSIASKRNATPTGWNLQINSSRQLYFVFDVSSITSTLTVPLSTWTHFAVVREGTGTNQTKLYINGVNSGTGTVANNFNQTDALAVGSDRGLGSYLNGYIDDLRITNGYARYTANFTPPTAAFPLN